MLEEEEAAREKVAAMARKTGKGSKGRGKPKGRKGSSNSRRGGKAKGKRASKGGGKRGRSKSKEGGNGRASKKRKKKSSSPNAEGAEGAVFRRSSRGRARKVINYAEVEESIDEFEEMEDEDQTASEDEGQDFE